MVIKKFYSKKTWPLLLPLLLLAAGCKKNSGLFASLNNQLVCKINGSEWKTAENRFSGFYDLNPFVNKRYIVLLYRNDRQTIQFYINPPFRSGEYTLNHNTQLYSISTSPADHGAFTNEYPDFTPDDVYITNAVETGVINFTLMDTINKKIKAEFSFIGKDKRTGKKVTITDGYFEFHQ